LAEFVLQQTVENVGLASGDRVEINHPLVGRIADQIEEHVHPRQDRVNNQDPKRFVNVTTANHFRKCKLNDCFKILQLLRTASKQKKKMLSAKICWSPLSPSTLSAG
jgi:hypothetical protein